jgi:hypothetical protein
VSVLSGFDDGDRRQVAAEERARAVQARVEEMLASPEALMEGIARTDAARFAGPDADAEFARFLADQPDRALASLGRALLRGERPSDLAASGEFGELIRSGVDQLARTDPLAVVREIAENDRSLRE